MRRAYWESCVDGRFILKLKLKELALGVLAESLDRDAGSW